MISGAAQENTTATYNNLKVDFSKRLYQLAQNHELRRVI